MIEPHKHCINCGISVPPSENFCSEKCKEEWIKLIKKRKKLIIYQTVLLLVIIIILLIIQRI